MASVTEYSIFIAFIGLLLLSSMNEGRILIGTAKLCEKPSQTWSGFCGITEHCNNQCKDWEHASSGACHFSWGFKCFCYFETCN